MRSLKGHLARTSIMMIFISAGLVILMSFILIFVMIMGDPEGIQAVLKNISDIFAENPYGKHKLIYGFIIWTSVAATLVAAVCVIISVDSAGKIIKPVNDLKDAADRISGGDLEFDVLKSNECSEISDLGDSIEKIRLKLKENSEEEFRKKEERDLLVASISHDMRTPVTTIKGYAEGIMDGVADTPEKQKKYLDTIYSKTLLLEKLLDNMTEYSELEMGRMQYVFEYMDITAYLRDICEEYENDIAVKNIVFRYELPDRELMITGDRAKLKRVFDNIISNAVKYNKKDGMVMMQAEEHENGALIVISDNGRGIPEKDMKKIFEGFYRGDSSRSNIKGSGLGLAIAKQIVEKHRGRIWIKSEPDKGTEVYIYIPLSKRE